MTAQNTTTPANGTRTILIAALVVAAFFGAYRFASANSAPGLNGAAFTAAGALNGGTGNAGGGAPGGGAPGGGCCGGGGAPVEGTAVAEGGVQKISVDASGGYNPNVINLKAGVPAEITFGESGGCMAQVTSQQLGFFEDLTQGPRTVKLDGLQPGEYSFSCGMQMVFGTIVVK